MNKTAFPSSLIEPTAEERKTIHPTGCFNRMVSLGIYDPLDKRAYDFMQRKTWGIQAWCTMFAVYGFHTAKTAGYFKQIAQTRGAYVAVMAISSIIPGIISTVASAGFYTKMDDKYYPLYVDYIRSQLEEGN